MLNKNYMTKYYQHRSFTWSKRSSGGYNCQPQCRHYWEKWQTLRMLFT